ncbi:3-hydroxyisobutyryl-CoA hydrolase [Wenxinia saemankumensis]|uniref:3-hydroxyisobutyryl-CoA hydrolase n=1 Tax=Wenxinia saemankumensis TaxID=1447782 RepID=A0A1M6D1C4_9RHOB|nr:3-hydroxyisobutyryl-CoA hydrolase [Wenxinia saemankumensis]SHI66778.1 Enoyl-CoA hydratase/carnithine racemase [Wenxinia saemankumensis]
MSSAAGDEVLIRREGRAGRITLNRPGALNALTHDMVRRIDTALVDWAGDPAVELVLIDAAGAKAFCAGGDIAELYRAGRTGDFGTGRRFWRDEYRMNARLAEFPKPVIAFLHGFVMGGGVGVGCHASHRIVGESARIAMPECGIGLVPDVGGSWLLARAPGRLGAWLALTTARMTDADAILCGFADHAVPEAAWDALKAELVRTGQAGVVARAALPAPQAPLAEMRGGIDRLFAPGTLADLVDRLEAEEGEVARTALSRLRRNDPLAMAVTLELLRRQAGAPDIRAALELEYRATSRAMERGNFLEGIRAAIIDRDGAPDWPLGLREVPPEAVEAMLAPPGDAELTFEGRET